MKALQPCRTVLLALAGIHLLAISAVSLQSTFGALRAGRTILSPSADVCLQAGENFSGALVGRLLSPKAATRQLTELYLQGAGIERGYGFFAPNVPDNFKVVFEFHYPDGRSEYSLPVVGDAATGLRLVNLLDNVRSLPNAEVRELMLRMLALAAWQDHPEATRVRVVFGRMGLVSLVAFRAGEGPSYEPLIAYDYHFSSNPPQP